MKPCVLIVVFLLGCLTYDVRCQSGFGGLFGPPTDDDDYFEENGFSGAPVEDGKKDDGDNFDEIVCDNFNLDLCLQDFEGYDEYFYATARDGPLCWESYAAIDCMHSFAKTCFPDVMGKEDFLCKLNNFKDRITVLCVNESMTEEPSEEEVLECLENAETDAEECVEEIIPRIPNIIQENREHINVNDQEAAKNTVKCLVVANVLECTVNRLEDRCPEEVVENFVEGAEEAFQELLGSNCDIPAGIRQK